MSEQYTQIITALREKRLDTLERFFDRVVTAEQQALLDDNELKGRKAYSARKAKLETAMSFYSMEIAAELEKYELLDPKLVSFGRMPEITPDDLIGYRRKANVWAIARKMWEAGITLKQIT